VLFFLQWGEEITARAVNDVKHRGVETSGSTSLAMCVSAARAIHLPPPFPYSTVCKDGFFVLKLPLLQQFFHLAEKRWKDWLCSTNIPQFAHICGKSPSTMSEVQK